MFQHPWTAALLLGTVATPAGVVLGWLLPRPLDLVVALPLVLLDMWAVGDASPMARVILLVLGIGLTWLFYVLVARLVLGRMMATVLLLCTLTPAAAHAQAAPGPGSGLLAPVLSGAVLGALFALYAKNRPPEGQLRLLAVGLLVAALIYVGLALVNGDGRALAIEAAGVVLFGGLAWLGTRSAFSLALGWVAHVGWDVGLHLGTARAIVHPWYPLGCVGFDLIVAGFLLGAAGRHIDR